MLGLPRLRTSPPTAIGLLCSMLAMAALGAPAADATRAQEPGGAPSSTIGCTCAAAERANGWCDLHRVGYLASIPVRSELLFETLDAHGHDLDLGTFECAECKKAIAEEGFCGEHRVGFVRGLAYFSRLTYELARGVPTDRESITCPVCRRNAESHGWCDEHQRGMLGLTAVEDRGGFERAVTAIEVLRAAIMESERCERCAAAIVTDSDCPYHGIAYKDGKPVSGVEPPRP